MITVLRAHGLSVVIYAYDHEPAHVHVIGDGSAKILLVGNDGWPEMIKSQGMNRAEQRRALLAFVRHSLNCSTIGNKSMADPTDAELDAAAERGRIAEEIEPRAKSARYDRASGRVIVELKNDCVFAFPARLAQGLENATDDDLAEVEVIMSGYGLHWETLNEDHAIPTLLAGIFGSRKYMARLAGRATSPAKAAAARANGAKGGRPRKTAS